MRNQPCRDPQGGLPDDAGLICKMADRLEEFDAAFEMVYAQYLSSGLTKPNPFQRRVLPHHLQPSTNVFIAYQHGAPVCTTTLISDSPVGLPMDAVFPEEMDHKRQQGLAMAEVSCLASRAQSPIRFHRLLMRLLRLLCQHARRFGVDQLVVAVHPKHATYYEKKMGYRRFGKEATYESLGDAPAVALALDFREAEAVRPPAFNGIFGDPLPLMEILPRPMSPEVAEHFRPMVDLSVPNVPLLV